MQSNKRSFTFHINKIKKRADELLSNRMNLLAVYTRNNTYQKNEKKLSELKSKATQISFYKKRKINTSPKKPQTSSYKIKPKKLPDDISNISRKEYVSEIFPEKEVFLTVPKLTQSPFKMKKYPKKKYFSYENVIKRENSIIKKVYKISDEELENITKVKKQKDDYKLKDYQNNLLNSLPKMISADTKKKLEKELNIIYSDSLCDSLNNFLYYRSEEKKEKKVIDRLTKIKTRYDRNILKKIENEFHIINFNKKLPKIEFKKVFRRSFYIQKNN